MWHISQYIVFKKRNSWCHSSQKHATLLRISDYALQVTTPYFRQVQTCLMPQHPTPKEVLQWWWEMVSQWCNVTQAANQYPLYCKINVSSWSPVDFVVIVILFAVFVLILNAGYGYFGFCCDPWPMCWLCLVGFSFPSSISSTLSCVQICRYACDCLFHTILCCFVVFSGHFCFLRGVMEREGGIQLWTFFVLVCCVKTALFLTMRPDWVVLLWMVSFSVRGWSGKGMWLVILCIDHS